ncbi:MAG: cell division protein FtsK [Dictyoglomus sp. NZ13-RE01]|nr:MAG: cell division protein FtsK [Dictyoglomus sp. NZ13-RE01]
MPERIAVGIGIIFFNLFVILSWIFPQGGGKFGRVLVSFLKNTFGIYNLVFLLFESIIVYYLFKKEVKRKDIIALTSLFFSIFLFVSLFLFIDDLQRFGGFVSLFLKRFFYNYLGVSGILLLSLFLLFLSLYNFSLFSRAQIPKKIKRTKEVRREIGKPKVIKQETKEESYSANLQFTTNKTDVQIKKTFPPPLDLLSPNVGARDEEEDLEKLARKIEETLKNFKIESKVEEYHVGPSVIRFDISIAPGVRVSKILSLSNDLALALAVPSIRFETPVPGKSLVGIEVPRKKPSKVYLREILESKAFQNTNYSLPIALGKDLAGKPQVGNLADMLHLLIAGTTGSGKSMFINTLIISLLYKHEPYNLKFLMIDPKRVELSMYNRLYKKYLWYPVITEYSEASSVLKWAIYEMERRYKIFAEEEVRNIDEYNNKGLNKTRENLPYVVIIIDELNDLMMVAPKEIEDMICRLAQKARAGGIHLVVATQRPSVDVITGLIKANIPSRIAFAVSSQVDSRIIIDDNGAEKLLGKGDMLYLPIMSTTPIRLQAPFIEEMEIKKVVNYLSDIYSGLDSSLNLDVTKKEEEKIDDLSEDPLLPQVIELLEGRKIISTSYIQRRFRIGYNRAARILDILEEKGYVASQGEGKPKKVLKGGDIKN